MPGVGAIGRVSQTPFQGVSYLSKTFQSSQVHTPLHLGRITNSDESYTNYICNKTSWLTKPVWGNSRLLRGSDSRSLMPTKGDQHHKFHLSHLDKSHLNFGGGELSYGRSFPIRANYDVTALKRSDVRPTDELIPSSNKVDLRSNTINLPFPAEHPNSSHMPKYAVFPAHDTPDDSRHGREILSRSNTLPSTAPSRCDSYVVAEKIKGFPQRREVIRPVKDSERQPLHWHGHTFHQLVKGPDMQKQNFYPTSPTSVKPDFWDRLPSLTVSQKTAETLQNLEAVNGHSEYTRQYSAKETRKTKATENNDSNMQICQLETLPTHKKTDDKQDDQTILRSQHEKPYDSIYTKDYSVKQCHWNSPTSTPNSILRKGTIKKLNEARRNKSVKFSDTISFSNDSATSSSFVNPDSDIRRRSHLNEHKTTTHFTKVNNERGTPRAFTAPSMQRQSFLQTTPLVFPSSQTKQLQFYSRKEQQQPNTTKSFETPREDLRRFQDSYSRSAAHHNFHARFPENSPDIRRTPDLRITKNERRHLIPEIGSHSYYFHG